MRFVLLNQFYPPDVASTGQFLHDLARSLVGRGHQVKILCSQGSYNGEKRFAPCEKLEGVEVVRLAATGFGRRRFLGKIIDYASYYGLLFCTLMLQRERPDVIMSLTTPPYAGLLAKIAAKRHGCRHVHWIMDLYPDVMFAHGMAKRGGFVSRVLGALNRWQFKGAHQIFTIGPKMAEHVLAYCDGRNSSVCWIPLWGNEEPVGWPEDEPNPLRTARGWTSSDVVFLYSGNMGLGHRFNEFLEAARRPANARARWAFAGGGKRRPEVEEFARSNPAARIEFLDSVPYSQLRAHLCAADVHLASMDSAWQGTMVPSKLQGSFAVGRPVLYVGGRDCEIALWIQESGGGWVVDENDLSGLYRAIEEVCDPCERQKRGRAALEYARGHFLKSSACGRFVDLLEERSNLKTESRNENVTVHGSVSLPLS